MCATLEREVEGGGGDFGLMCATKVSWINVSLGDYALRPLCEFYRIFGLNNRYTTLFYADLTPLCHVSKKKKKLRRILSMQMYLAFVFCMVNIKVYWLR